jgi:hypothetical protein
MLLAKADFSAWREMLVKLAGLSLTDAIEKQSCQSVFNQASFA